MKTKTAKSKHRNVPGGDEIISNREILTALLKQWRQRLSYYSMFAALPAILTSLAQEVRADDANKSEASIEGQTTRLTERLDNSLSKPKLLRRRNSFLSPIQKSKYNFNAVLAGGDNCPGSVIPGGNYTAAAPFTDSGNTTGANNTVKELAGYYYYSSAYNAAGPDQIYSFTLTGRGANPQIKVSATSTAYKPMIYILDSRFYPGCPAGTNNSVKNWFNFAYSPSPGGAAIFESQDLNYLQLNVPYYLFVDSAVSVANDSGPYTLRIQDVTIAPAVPQKTKFDFDGDGKADISVFRPSNRVWYLNRSQAGFAATQFGLATDKLAPADYDGDGRTEIAVFRDGTWYVQTSGQDYYNFKFGSPGDVPVPADYNGDGIAEAAVFRPSNGTWYVSNQRTNQYSIQQWGLATDTPVAADYDGDGKTDYAVYRPSNGTWYLLRSRDGFAAIQFGLSTDKIVPADYDNDGKTDLAVYRDGIWYLLRSQSGFTTVQFGLATDAPAPADYDGDGKIDLAVYRDGVWYLLESTNGNRAVQFGLSNDKPIPTAYLP